MSNLEHPPPKNTTASPPVEAPPAPPAASEIMRRCRREDRLKRRSLALPGFGLLFSLLTFIIMASNKHGDRKNFDKYEEYRYVLGIAILSTLYAGGQALRQVHELSTGKQRPAY